jgi:hypothetical protein
MTTKEIQNQTNEQWLKDYRGETKVTATAKDTGGGDFKKVPSGTHIAVCNMVVNLGDQPTQYQGKDTGLKSQVYIRWETPHERIEYEIDGVKKEGPLTIGKTYTMSLSEKATLRKDLEAWRGIPFTQEQLDGFDVDAVLGACCQIIVAHRESDGNEYANVTGIAGWPKGMDRVLAENDLISYAADNTAQYGKLPKWIRENKLNGSPETPAAEAPSFDDFDDDIPF